MTLEKLKRELLWWNKAAVVAPIFVTAFLALLWYATVCPPEFLFYTACGLYFATAVIWWWWTMRGIYYLVGLMQAMQNSMGLASDELKNIRKELQVDNKRDN